MCDHASVTKIVLPTSPFTSMKQPNEALSLPDVHSALIHRDWYSCKIEWKDVPKKALRNIKRINLVSFVESKVQVIHCCFPFSQQQAGHPHLCHSATNAYLKSCLAARNSNCVAFFFFFSSSGLLYSWAKQNICPWCPCVVQATWRARTVSATRVHLFKKNKITTSPCKLIPFFASW